MRQLENVKVDLSSVSSLNKKARELETLEITEVIIIMSDIICIFSDNTDTASLESRVQGLYKDRHSYGRSTMITQLVGVFNFPILKFEEGKSATGVAFCH